MDYKAVIAALTVASTMVTMADGIVSSSVVGYQNKGFENSGYTIVANTFLPVGGATDAMTLEDIKVNDAFVNSKLVFMTTGGANAKTTWNGKSVNKSYVYWTEDDAEDGAGWYLDADVDATVNCNETVTFDPGDGFLVNRMSSEASATITMPSAL